MKKIFVDTNILISYIDTGRHNHKDATTLLNNFYLEENTKILFSQDMLTTIYYHLAKKHNIIFYLSILKALKLYNMQN